MIGVFMISKTKIFLLVGVILGVVSSVIAGKVIPLSTGQSVNLNGTTITCNMDEPTTSDSDTIVYDGDTYRMSMSATGHGIVRNMDTGQMYDLGGTVIDVPVGVVYNNQLYFFVRGTDQAVYYKTLAGASGSWNYMQGGLMDKVQIFMVNGEPHLFGRGLDSAAYYRTLNQAWTPLNGGLLDPMNIVMLQNQPYIVGRGTDRNIWYRTLNQSWTSLGGTTNEPILEVMKIKNSDILIRVMGTDGQIYQRTLNNSWVVEP